MKPYKNDLELINAIYNESKLIDIDEQIKDILSLASKGLNNIDIANLMQIDVQTISNTLTTMRQMFLNKTGYFGDRTFAKIENVSELSYEEKQAIADEIILYNNKELSLAQYRMLEIFVNTKVRTVDCFYELHLSTSQAISNINKIIYQYKNKTGYFFDKNIYLENIEEPNYYLIRSDARVFDNYCKQKNSTAKLTNEQADQIYDIIHYYLNTNYNQLISSNYDDIAQEIMLLVLKNWYKFNENTGTLANWVCKIAENHMKALYVTHTKEQKVLSLDEKHPDDHEEDSFELMHIIPSDFSTSKEVEMREIIDSLPLVAQLKLKGYTEKEISAKLGISEEIINRELDSLREKLTEYGFGPKNIRSKQALSNKYNNIINFLKESDLKDRKRRLDIITRYGNGETYNAIADSIGLSAQRVSQIVTQTITMYTKNNMTSKVWTNKVSEVNALFNFAQSTKMPKFAYEIIKMRYEGKSISEIAETLNITRTFVHVKLRRIREMYYKYIAKNGEIER